MRRQSKASLDRDLARAVAERERARTIAPRGHELAERCQRILTDLLLNADEAFEIEGFIIATYGCGFAGVGDITVESAEWSQQRLTEIEERARARKSQC